MGGKSGCGRLKLLDAARIYGGFCKHVLDMSNICAHNYTYISAGPCLPGATRLRGPSSNHLSPIPFNVSIAICLNQFFNIHSAIG